MQALRPIRANRTLSVLIADDHPQVRETLRVLLERHQYRVVGEAAHGGEAVALTRKLRPQVVLLDFSMPVLSGPEAARKILARAPAVKIVIVSVHSDHDYVLEALRAGVSGYVIKNRAAEDLAPALAAVARGLGFVSPPVCRAAVDAWLVESGRIRR